MSASLTPAPALPAKPMTKAERFNFVVNVAFGGWHHVSARRDLQGAVRFSVYGDLSTYDWNNLTRLVLACHAVFVRASVEQSGPRMVAIVLSCRAPRKDEGSINDDHPSIADLCKQAAEIQARADVCGGIEV